MPFSIRKDAGDCDGFAVVNTDTGKVMGCHPSQEKAQKQLAALKVNVEDAMLQEIDGKLYATARAYVVETPSDLPREIASEFDRSSFNPSFVWIAGRYVQANQANRNGHFWSFTDLQKAERTIRYTPMNVLHQWERPVGTLVETKIVHRENVLEASDDLLPEIQALGVLWAANFPQVAEAAKAAHAQKKLWYSMECVAEQKQCMECERVFAFAAQPHETCEHLAASPKAPRRFINPVFLGGALIFPPKRPGWKDADITEVAQHLTEEFAHREGDLEVTEWEEMMSLVLSS